MKKPFHYKSASIHKIYFSTYLDWNCFKRMSHKIFPIRFFEHFRSVSIHFNPFFKWGLRNIGYVYNYTFCRFFFDFEILQQYSPKSQIIIEKHQILSVYVLNSRCKRDIKKKARLLIRTLRKESFDRLNYTAYISRPSSVTTESVIGAPPNRQKGELVMASSRKASLYPFSTVLHALAQLGTILHSLAHTIFNCKILFLSNHSAQFSTF